jgi:hypothetical protein
MEVQRHAARVRFFTRDWCRLERIACGFTREARVYLRESGKLRKFELVSVSGEVALDIHKERTQNGLSGKQPVGANSAQHMAHRRG